jgi:ParB family chromosome partitioning protein
MTTNRSTKIEMIPIDRIALVNPRSRGKVKFKQIVDNISRLGLKKPITAAKRRSRSGEPQYDLVCGQGRLEAYQALGQTEVPAFVIEASKEDLLLMSLAENLARRVRGSAELMSGIAALKDRGYTYSQIAKKTDLQTSYVKGVVRLLRKGEERLLRAVEREQIPVSVAVTIATADEAQVQRVLAEAYEKNALRGKDLLRARQLIEQRRSRGKRLKSTGPRKNGSIDTEMLLKEYQKETARQRLLIKQSKLCETRLLFVIASLRQLLRDKRFVVILQKEALDELPRNLAEQIHAPEEGS